MIKIRPIGVTAIGLLGIIVGLITFIPSSAAIVGASLLHIPALIPYAILINIFGADGAIFGLVYAIVGYLVYKGYNWAWFVAVAFYAMGVIISLLSMINSIFYAIPLAISAIILYYLTRISVRSYFDV